ncbi:hypothetical protein MTBUT4_280053 [Magnetospirillum sp. UT-4]|nr:hypothetical protein MTBUT4_280053 [Magnetospirillum sp. UT-4]
MNTNFKPLARKTRFPPIRDIRVPAERVSVSIRVAGLGDSRAPRMAFRTPLPEFTGRLADPRGYAGQAHGCPV